MLRIWGQGLAQYQCYCFDFVNEKQQYIRTPEDIKIYSVAAGFTPAVQLLSIEQSLEKSGASSLLPDPSKHNPNKETYIIPEGTIIRVQQANHPDVLVQIPVRTPTGRTAVFQPLISLVSSKNLCKFMVQCAL